MKKFIDSANITVVAGNGGDGYVGFQKKRQGSMLGRSYGSNGGDGGDVWLLVDSNINTLSYFNYNRVFKAGSGMKGGNRGCTGKRGKDLIVKVPCGTRISCCKTNQLLGDITNERGSDRLMVAKGGRRGLGNNKYFKYRFVNFNNVKDVINYNKIQGSIGEVRHLCLELFLMADVGVFGLPNSGKSSFLSVVSNATPKVANYPFTTLVPNLGIVQMDAIGNRFIIADVPGIIKGASLGLGLGVQFLKHLKHCQMLLHFIDINPLDSSDPIDNVIILEKELSNYDIELTSKTRWLVFNKIDLLDTFELQKRIGYISQSLSQKERCYFISVENNINIKLLCNDIMQFIQHKTSVAL